MKYHQLLNWEVGLFIKHGLPVSSHRSEHWATGWLAVLFTERWMRVHRVLVDEHWLADVAEHRRELASAYSLGGEDAMLALARHLRI